ncbi:MAG: hypothetical protein R3F02_19335 [Thiolinea sp.]
MQLKILQLKPGRAIKSVSDYPEQPLKKLLKDLLNTKYIFFAVLLALIFGLAGCEPEENESMPNRPPLTLRYQTSAEAMYTDIRVENGRLSYTFFEDTDNRCAQWFKSTPCWSEADLQTRERQLTVEELDKLYALAEKMHRAPLNKEVYGETNLRKRAYTETLTVGYSKDVPQQLRYRSSPQAGPKPEVFAELENVLLEYAAEMKSAGKGK